MINNRFALYTVAEIRQIERAAFSVLPSYTLMQRAGTAAAEHVVQLLAGKDGAILVLVGPGNNGGDALEAASQLAHSGRPVAIYLSGDPAQLPDDAHYALQRAQSSPAKFIDYTNLLDKDWACVIDGLFGIGLTRLIAGKLSELIAQINTLPCPILALDVPSGLNADKGTIVGEHHDKAIKATHTITFIGNKPGLYTCDGRDYAGEVLVSDLALDPSLFPTPFAQLNHPALFSHAAVARRHNSHKGSYGDVSVLGGAHGMVGAAILTARTAAKCGAGRVFLGCLAETGTYDHAQPELMLRHASELDLDNTAVVAGPGLGASPEALKFLVQAIAASGLLVLDADALNLISDDINLQSVLSTRTAATILTPHPLEAARLLGITTQQVQSHRPVAARALAEKFNAIAILKGSGTVIAAPDGKLVINPTGNPALATAGSGDVLSGLCGALLAQSWPAWEAALGAVWIHGKAADKLVQQGIGPIGLTASELIPEIRAVLNQSVLESQSSLTLRDQQRS